MKPYRIFECFPNGTFTDTGHIIHCDETKKYDNTGGSIISDVFKVYGFDQYVNYYSVLTEDKDIGIYYNRVKTWLLRLEPENEGESQ